MAGDAATSGRIDPRQVAGLKRLRHLLPLLEPLRRVGCERDAAGNRELHFDQYVTLVLLYLFNPLIGSVRALQQAAAIDKVSEQLGVKRFSLGSFSESVRVFDPEKLRGVITQLAGEMRPVNADPRLAEHLKGPLKLADGTVLDAIVTVAEAAWLPLQDGTAKHAWRLGCRHLLSHKPQGVMIQVYCALIAGGGLRPASCMLINLWTGKKPGKRTVEMLAFYFMGVASEKEVLEHLSRPDNTGEAAGQGRALEKTRRGIKAAGRAGAAAVDAARYRPPPRPIPVSEMPANHPQTLAPGRIQ